MNSEKNKSESENLEYPDLSKYQITVSTSQTIDSVFVRLPAVSSSAMTTKPAKYANELTLNQKQFYQINISTFKFRQQNAEKVTAGIRILDYAIKSSAKTYIPSKFSTAIVKKLLQVLQQKYQRTNDQITEQIELQYHALKTPPTKNKIEQWVAD